MPTTRRSSRQLAISLVAAGLGLLSVAAPAAAQRCCDDWSQPYVCEVEIWVYHPGLRGARLEPAAPLPIVAGEYVDLELRALDQRGRTFSRERLGLGVEPDRACRDLLKIEEGGPGRYRISSKGERGRCELRLWIPGNLHLEWSLYPVVGPRFARGFDRAEAEEVTRRLYAALLGREPDPTGMTNSTGDLQRGRLPELVDSMLRSHEFWSKASAMSAAAQLERMYQGLLGRAPDSSGARTYLPMLERREHLTVVLELLQSEEFEEALVDATKGR